MVDVQHRHELRDLQAIVAQREAALGQLTANGPARVIALTANGRPDGARLATIVVRGFQIEVIVERLNALQSDKTYWLWTLNCDSGKPTYMKPIQSFTISQRRFSVRDIGSNPSVSSATCFALAVEDGAVTPKAPSRVVALGTDF